MMKKRLVALSLALTLVFALFGNVFAESYPNGVLGIKAASVPPPGTYLKNFNAFIFADKMIDKDGDELPIGFDVLAYVNCSQFIWVSNKKILGADYFADFLVPIWAADVEIKAMNAHLHDYGLGDIILEPLGLAWHGARYDAVFAAGVIVPTGDEALPIGTYNQWTGLISFGGTGYFDDKKTWSVSLLNRMEFNTKDTADDLTRGSDFHFEWGLGKTLTTKKIMWDVGVAGYCQWQISDDRGPNASADKGKPDTTYAVGPELQAFFLPYKFMVNARVLTEFGVKSADGLAGGPQSRPEGMRIFITLIKIF